MSSPLGRAIAQLRAILGGTLGAEARVFEADLVFATDRKGDLNGIAQEFALDFSFKQKIAAVADNEQLRHGAAVTEAAMPGAAVFGVGRNETALFFVLAAKVISVEIPTVDRFLHWQWFC